MLRAHGSDHETLLPPVLKGNYTVGGAQSADYPTVSLFTNKSPGSNSPGITGEFYSERITKNDQSLHFMYRFAVHIIDG